MIKAVFDANLLVSAFLSRDNPAGASNALLRLVRQGGIHLYLSPEIIGETLAVLIASERFRNRYGHTPAMAIEYCDNLRTVVTMVVNPPATPGAVPRDPDDDNPRASDTLPSARDGVSSSTTISSVSSKLISSALSAGVMRPRRSANASTLATSRLQVPEVRHHGGVGLNPLQYHAGGLGPFIPEAPGEGDGSVDHQFRHLLPSSIGCLTGTPKVWRSANTFRRSTA